MGAPVRVTGPLLDVMEAFLHAFDGGAELHGWAIMKATGRSGPTVYGVLDRLEDAGWVDGRWEDQSPSESRPRRRLYRLTAAGRVAAYDLLAARRPDALWGPPSPAPDRRATGRRGRGSTAGGG